MPCVAFLTCVSCNLFEPHEICFTSKSNIMDSSMMSEHTAHLTQCSHLKDNPGLLKEVFGQRGPYNNPAVNQDERQSTNKAAAANLNRGSNKGAYCLVRHLEIFLQKATLGWLTGECGCGGTCQSGWSCRWGWSWHSRNSPGWERPPWAGQGGERKKWSKDKHGRMTERYIRQWRCSFVFSTPVAGCRFCPDTWSWGSGLSAW